VQKTDITTTETKNTRKRKYDVGSAHMSWRQSRHDLSKAQMSSRQSLDDQIGNDNQSEETKQKLLRTLFGEAEAKHVNVW
jgi:hypothetical protein